MDATTEADLLRTAAGARLLDDRVVAVVGEDAREWLHGQTTIDLRERRTRPGYGLVLEVKGRIVGDFHVIDRGPIDGGPEERLDLVLPGAQADAILERLERFLVMEDVELEPQPVRVVSIQGPTAGDVTLPAHADAHPIDRLGSGGVDWLVPGPAVDDALDALPVPTVSEAGWELARIRGARPRMGVDFGGDTLPQEAGLARRALAFDQGCYVGQEPVVMLEHRGKPPKRLVRLELTEGPAPAVGDPVLADAREVGRVTSAAPDGPGAVALALVKRKALEGDAPLELTGRHPAVTLVE